MFVLPIICMGSVFDIQVWDGFYTLYMSAHKYIIYI